MPWSDLAFFVLIQAAAGGVLALFLPPVFGLPAAIKRPYVLAVFLLPGLAFPFMPSELFGDRAAVVAAVMSALLVCLFLVARGLIRAAADDATAGRRLLWAAGLLALLLLTVVAVAFPGGHTPNFSQPRLAADLVLSALMIGATLLLFLPLPALPGVAVVGPVLRFVLITAAFRALLTLNNALALRTELAGATGETGWLIGLRLLAVAFTLLAAGALWYITQAGRRRGPNAPNGNGSTRRLREYAPPLPWRVALLMLVLLGQAASAALLAGVGLLL